MTSFQVPFVVVVRLCLYGQLELNSRQITTSLNQDGCVQISYQLKRKITLAVVAIEVTVVILLMIDFVMHTPTFRTYITIFVLGFNDEINGIVLGRESLEKIKLVHTLCF